MYHDTANGCDPLAVALSENCRDGVAAVGGLQTSQLLAVREIVGVRSGVDWTYFDTAG